MNHSASDRWSAARRIYEICPQAVEDLDICLDHKPGSVSRKAKKETWSGSVVAARIRATKPTADHVSTGWLSDAVDRIAVVVSRQITAIEENNANGGAPDEVLKLSASLTKTLSALEEMRSKLEKATDAQSGDDQDVLEVHRRIIEKIEAAVDAAEAG